MIALLRTIAVLCLAVVQGGADTSATQVDLEATVLGWMPEAWAIQSIGVWFIKAVDENGWHLFVRNNEGTYDRARLRDLWRVYWMKDFKGLPILIYSDEKQAWVKP